MSFKINNMNQEKTKEQPHVFVYPEGDQYPKVIGIEWRSGSLGTVGIVAIQRSDETWRAYIGIAHIGAIEQVLGLGNLNESQANAMKQAGGNSEKADAIEIMKWGTPLSEMEAHAFFPHIQAYKLNYIKD